MKLGLNPARGAIVAALIIGAAAVPAQAQLRQALDTGEQATRKAEQTQQRINQLDDERSDLVRDFRTTIQRTDAAKLYVRQQQKVVESQRRELVSLEDQLGRVDEITVQMIPMMLDMIDDLDKFVQADLPFKKDFRQQRVDSLRANMEDPQVSNPERYRLIVEAYQQELEYGRTTNTWEETINVDGKDITVDMMQYGRVALVYMSPDQRTAKRWQRGAGGAGGEWVNLEGKYKEDVAKAVRIAKGLAQPEVMQAPIQKLSLIDDIDAVTPAQAADEPIVVPPAEPAPAIEGEAPADGEATEDAPTEE